MMLLGYVAHVAFVVIIYVQYALLFDCARSRPSSIDHGPHIDMYVYQRETGIQRMIEARKIYLCLNAIATDYNFVMNPIVRMDRVTCSEMMILTMRTVVYKYLFRYRVCT